jgi:TonB family protein
MAFGPARLLNFSVSMSGSSEYDDEQRGLEMYQWAVILLFALAASFAAGQQSPDQPAGQTAPRLFFAPDPDYTAEAAQRGVEGEVHLKIEVLSDGSTNNVRVAKSLDAGLDQSAVETVRHWRFQPSTKNGTPVLTEISIVVQFRAPPPTSLRPGVYTGFPCVAKIDSREVKDLLKKASKGEPKAQLAVGCAYQYGGAGLAKDRAQAINWYGKAAETGLVPAQHFLGETYLLNFDYVRAYAWLKIADSGGYKIPSDRLIRKGELVSPDQVAVLLSADQLNEAEAKVAEWKQQHGTK